MCFDNNSNNLAPGASLTQICFGNCRPSRRSRWYNVSFWWTRLRDSRLEALKREHAALKQRVDAMRPGLTEAEVIGLIKKHTPACTCTHTCAHTCTPVAETRRAYTFAFVLAIVGFAIGLGWAFVDADYAQMVVYRLASRFVLGNAALLALLFGVVGFGIDWMRDKRVEVTR